MSDRLEQNLRETLSERAAQLDRSASARLRAIDYRPRRRRLPALPALGALGAAGTAGVLAIIMLGSSAAPAFAGWSPAPTQPAPGQLVAAEQGCSHNHGAPVLTDTRGPFTAAIYVDGAETYTCLQGPDGASIDSTNGGPGAAAVSAGQVQLDGDGMQNSSGQALTLVDGRIGAGVTAVQIDRSEGSAVQATVSGGWYLAWWPGTARATTAEVSTATGIATQQYPSPGQLSAPACPAGANCGSAYGFGSAAGGQSAIGSGFSSGAGGHSSSHDVTTVQGSSTR